MSQQESSSKKEVKREVKPEVKKLLETYNKILEKGYFSTSAYITGKPGTDYEYYDVLYYVVGATEAGERADLPDETYMQILRDYVVNVERGIAAYIIRDPKTNKEAIVLVCGGRKLLNQVIGSWFEALLEDIKNGILTPRVVKELEAKIVHKEAKI